MSIALAEVGNIYDLVALQSYWGIQHSLLITGMGMICWGPATVIEEHLESFRVIFCVHLIQMMGPHDCKDIGRLASVGVGIGAGSKLAPVYRRALATGFKDAMNSKLSKASCSHTSAGPDIFQITINVLIISDVQHRCHSIIGRLSAPHVATTWH